MYISDIMLDISYNIRCILSYLIFTDKFEATKTNNGKDCVLVTADQLDRETTKRFNLTVSVDYDTTRNKRQGKVISLSRHLGRKIHIVL